MSGTRAAPRTASRYQRGLTYEPGMAESRYRPERATGGGGGPVTGVGGGVSPIGPPTDDEGVVAPIGGGGGGMGGAALGGAGLLAALANPSLIRQLGGLLGGSGAGAVSGVTQGSTSLGAGAAAPTAGAPIAPVSALAPEAATQGATSGGVAGSGGAGSGGAGAAATGLYGLPIVSLGGTEFGSAVLPAGWGASAGNQVLYSPTSNLFEGAIVGPGSQTVMDGGLGSAGLGADLVGEGALTGAGAAGNGMGGAFGFGGLSLVPQDYGLGTLGTLGNIGGIDVLGGLGTIGAGYLGQQWAGQADYEGSRDPAGSQIGSTLGATVGGLFLGPLGAFLGAQFGGMLGGQFGPQATVGENMSAPISFSPTGLTVGQAGADNGGDAAAAASLAAAFAPALQQYAASRGYTFNQNLPENTYSAALGYFGPGRLTETGGYFYQPTATGVEWADPRFFINDLSAPYANINAPNSYYFPDLAQGATGWDALLNYGFNDMVDRGILVAPGGTAQQFAPMTVANNSGGVEPSNA